MRFIPTKIHAALDYIVGVLFICMPWILNLSLSSAASWIFILMGIAALLYSMFTDYELGAFRKINMSTHLILDALNGILLAGSPWLFGFQDVIWKPHVIAGVFEIIASLISKNKPTATPFKRTVYHHTIV